MRANLTGHHITPLFVILGNFAIPFHQFERCETDPNSRDRISTLNMFSFIPRSAHLARKRIFAPAYSRSSIHCPRVQRTIKTRTIKLIRFLSNQTSANPSGTFGYLIPRNIFRALGTDIFTAFAFSDAEGTRYIDELRAGANTMEELGMDVWELWHEDKRDIFRFLENQPEVKHFSKFLAPYGQAIHSRIEAWVLSVIKQYEARLSSYSKTASKEKDCSEQGVYWRQPTVPNTSWLGGTP